MTRNRRTTILGAVLAALAGFIDAMGYLHLHGSFVSFMSGNSTRLSVGIAEGDRGAVATAAALIGVFGLGAMGGAAVERSVRSRRRAWVLSLETAVLLVSAVLHHAGFDRAAIGGMAFAMGAENAVFVHAGRVTVGLTYVTGALVKAAHGLVAALFGGRWTLWAPDALLWLSLILGAVGGSRLYGAIGLDGLWLAAAVCGACLTWTWADPAHLEG